MQIPSNKEIMKALEKAHNYWYVQKRKARQLGYEHPAYKEASTIFWAIQDAMATLLRARR